jgi:hypothetical protein
MARGHEHGASATWVSIKQAATIYAWRDQNRTNPSPYRYKMLQFHQSKEQKQRTMRAPRPASEFIWLFQTLAETKSSERRKWLTNLNHITITNRVFLHWYLFRTSNHSLEIQCESLFGDLGKK